MPCQVCTGRSLRRGGAWRPAALHPTGLSGAGCSPDPWTPVPADLGPSPKSPGTTFSLFSPSLGHWDPPRCLYPSPPHPQDTSSAPRCTKPFLQPLHGPASLPPLTACSVLVGSSGTVPGAQGSQEHALLCSQVPRPCLHPAQGQAGPPLSGLPTAGPVSSVAQCVGCRVYSLTSALPCPGPAEGFAFLPLHRHPACLCASVMCPDLRVGPG